MADDEKLGKLIWNLGMGTPRARRRACVKLGRLEDGRTVEPLIRAVGDYDEDVRRAAREALKQLGDPRAVEALIQRLDDEAGSVRESACEALGQLGDLRAVEPLIQRLDDEDWRVSYAAFQALRAIGAPAVEPLIRELRHNNNGVRRMACEALGQLGDLRAVEPLIQQLGYEAGYDLRPTCEALGQLGDPRAVEPLIRRLGDEDNDVRRAASEALGQLGDPRAVEPLIQRLGDRKGYVRQAACEALGSLLGTDVSEANRVRDVLNSFFSTHEPQRAFLLCEACLTRPERKARKLGPLAGVQWLQCPTCGRAVTPCMDGVLIDVRQVIAVLNGEMGGKALHVGDSVRANWLKLHKLFDFDSVEIVNATDDHVMRFCVQVGNDTDDFRRKRYKKMPVTIAPECRLEENTLRNLRALFGKVSEGAL